MKVTDLFWLFFILMAIQPILRQKFLEAARRRQLTLIETERNSRLILLIHRQETMSLVGFPILRYIDVNDSEDVLRAIHLTDSDVPIDLVLHTPGGLALASLQIARAIADRKAKVTVFVPHYAMSGGTLIALAADEIVMSPHAALGPVDPQIGQHAASSILKVIEQKPIGEIDDDTIMMADQARKAVAQMRDDVRDLLRRNVPADRIEGIVTGLTSGKWTHDYPISPAEARDIGLPVSTDIPESILRLLELYPQPVNRRPTVEYVPMPRHTGGGGQRTR